MGAAEKGACSLKTPPCSSTPPCITPMGGRGGAERGAGLSSWRRLRAAQGRGAAGPGSAGKGVAGAVALSTIRLSLCSTLFCEGCCREGCCNEGSLPWPSTPHKSSPQYSSTQGGLPITLQPLQCRLKRPAHGAPVASLSLERAARSFAVHTAPVVRRQCEPWWSAQPTPPPPGHVQ